MTDAPRLSRDESRKKILELLQDAHPHGITFKNVVDRFGRSASYTNLLLAELEAQGDAERTTGRKPVIWRASHA